MIERFAAFAAIVGSAVAVAAALTVACESRPAEGRAPLHLACDRVNFDGAVDTESGRCANAEVICYLRGSALSCVERRAP